MNPTEKPAHYRHGDPDDSGMAESIFRAAARDAQARRGEK